MLLLLIFFIIGLFLFAYKEYIEWKFNEMVMFESHSIFTCAFDITYIYYYFDGAINSGWLSNVLLIACAFSLGVAVYRLYKRDGDIVLDVSELGDDSENSIN